MRKKISTIMDESLFRRAKMESARRGKQISEIVSEALEQYLSTGIPYSVDVVAESWGVMKVSPKKLKKVMEEDGLLDS